MARTRWNKDRQDAFLQLAARGHNVAKICRAIGICRKTFYRWCGRHPAFSEQVEKARAQGEIKLADLAWKQALAGDGPMIRFLLSRRFGWSEKHHVEFKDVTPERMARIQELASLSPEERTAVDFDSCEEETIQ